MSLTGPSLAPLRTVSTAIALCVLSVPCASRADPVATRHERPRADASRVARSPAGGSRSPATGTLLTPTPAEGDEAAGAARGPEADPLVTNGLGSPSCRSSIDLELSEASRRNCQTSGFMAAGAPTGDYGLDVHIDTGLLPFSGGNLLSTVQGLLVTPEWLGLVWLVHSLVVMLEWCFALDLIDSASAGGLTAGLASAQASFTTPLLAATLAVAATLAAYHGLVRRRVAQTLGEAAMTVAMLVGGLWLMLDPTGTVGALSRWGERAALGTLAVGAEGSPATPGRALGSNLSGIFTAAVEAPWCYLEFGDVGWCRESAALDSNVRAAGMRIAAREASEAGCRGSATSCGRSMDAQRLLASARLLREARTNGALFLALPPNGADRNSINDSGSLLHALCGTSNTTSCTAPGASEAEFRTNAGTWARVTGLLLIAIGLLGMLLLFGYVAVRLLTAAAMSLVYLLLVPGVVVVPALGERGRALFRAWIARLFGAVLSKLLFAFLLGVLLAVTSVVERLDVLGWWAQWLLLSAFWWATFLRRHQLLAIPPQVIGEARRVSQRGGLRALRETLETGRHGVEWQERRKERQHRMASLDAVRLANPASRTPAKPTDASLAVPAAAEPWRDEQALRTLDVEADASPREMAKASARIAERAPRRERLEEQHRAADAAGDLRRSAGLRARRDRLRTDDASDEAILATAVQAGHAGDGPVGRERLAGRVRFLEQQADLPPAASRATPGRRDYAALAGLLHRSRSEYEQLPPGRQRLARLEIDRELATRRGHVPPVQASDPASPHGAGRDRAEVAHGSGSPAQASRRRSRPPAAAARRPLARQAPAEESPVMRDARAVAEGRKRQLGIGRP
jgi:hypothetical protein